MAEKVWVRDYAEKYGCKVDWNPELKTVVLDGSYNLWPDEVRNGKAYIDKRVIDAALRYLGYDISEEAPPTSKPSEEMEEEEREAEDEEREISDRFYTASRGLLKWGWVKAYIDKTTLKKVYDWAIDHIWKPTVDWGHDTYNSLRGLIPSFHQLYEGAVSFLSKVKQGIVDKFLHAIDVVNEWYGYTVNWVKFNLAKLEYLVSDEIFMAIFNLRFYLQKFIWLVEDAFEQIFYIVTQTADAVAEYIVRTFHSWVDSVGSMLEDYIVEHWED